MIAFLGSPSFLSLSSSIGSLHLWSHNFEITIVLRLSSFLILGSFSFLKPSSEINISYLSEGDCSKNCGRFVTEVLLSDVV